MINEESISPWIRLPRPAPNARLRLFCFPYAGGSAATFHKWSSALSPLIEVRPIELPGRGDRMSEPLLRSMTVLVETLAEVIPGCFDKPYAFFGHSMGAFISFELAHKLREQGKPAPVHLFLSGCRPRSGVYSDNPKHNLPDSDFIDALRGLKGTPAGVLENAELLEILLPVLRADFELLEKHLYVQTNLLDCPITALGGLEDTEATSIDLWKWAGASAGRFAVRMFPGDHFFIRSEEASVMGTVLQTLMKQIPSVIDLAPARPYPATPRIEFVE